MRKYYAHNGYLQTAAETGVTGLLLLLAGLLFLLTRAAATAGRQPAGPDSARLWALWTGLCGFLIMTSVDTIMHNNQSVMLFWFWLGLCGGLIRKKRPAPHERRAARLTSLDHPFWNG